MVHPNDIIEGKYEVVGLLGEGGMSRVWMARDFRLGKFWALKEVAMTRVGDAALEASCLMSEARTLRELDHPALPRVVDVFEADDAILLVMDYVRGRSLDRVTACGEAPSEAMLRQWGIALCDVLGYLHSHEPPIVYRDMKPSNVMLCDDGSLRLVDFGTATVAPSGGTGAPSLGTRSYASPEQLRGDVACDARSDLYSLGATLLRVALGPGHEGSCSPGELASARPDLTAAFDGVVAKAMREDPQDRYATAEEMAADLMASSVRDSSEGAAEEANADSTAAPAEFGDAAGTASGEERADRGFFGRRRSRRQRGARRRRPWDFVPGTKSHRSSRGPGAVRSVALLCGAGILGTGLVSALCAYGRTASAYSESLESARVASCEAGGDGESEAEGLCLRAIEARPEEVEPYLLLVERVYLDDAQFSAGEGARWEEVARTWLPEARHSAGYARVCFDVGMLYYVYASDGDDARGAIRAAAWFEECGRACDDGDAAADDGLSGAASAYATVCGFCRDLALAERAGGQDALYASYWQALEDAMAWSEDGGARLASEGYADAPDGGSSEKAVGGANRLRAEGMARLRLCETVGQALASPTYVAGFLGSGVTLEQIDGLLGRVERLASAESCSEGTGSSEATRWKGVIEAVGQARTSIGLMDGSAASAPE